MRDNAAIGEGWQFTGRLAIKTSPDKHESVHELDEEKEMNSRYLVAVRKKYPDMETN